MNFRSNVSGSTTCWNDHENVMIATAIAVLPDRMQKRGGR
jgi:hypothetical protein